MYEYNTLHSTNWQYFVFQHLATHIGTNPIEFCLIYNIILGRNLFTSEGNLRRGLGSGPFRITPTRWCGNGCPHVRPHPGLTNLEFGRVYLYFR